MTARSLVPFLFVMSASAVQAAPLTYSCQSETDSSLPAAQLSVSDYAINFQGVQFTNMMPVSQTDMYRSYLHLGTPSLEMAIPTAMIVAHGSGGVQVLDSSLSQDDPKVYNYDCK